jgi:hypothetical protein
VADVVNIQSSIYKSPPQCRDRYDHVIALREEGRLTDEYSRKLKKMKAPLSHMKVNRTAKTHMQVLQDKGKSETELSSSKFDIIHSTAMKRTAIVKPSHAGIPGVRSIHKAVLEERGVTLDSPMRAAQLAVQRAENLAREKASGTTSTNNNNRVRTVYLTSYFSISLMLSG